MEEATRNVNQASNNLAKIQQIQGVKSSNQPINNTMSNAVEEAREAIGVANQMLSNNTGITSEDEKRKIELAYRESQKVKTLTENRLQTVKQNIQSYNTTRRRKINSD